MVVSLPPPGIVTSGTIAARSGRHDPQPHVSELCSARNAERVASQAWLAARSPWTRSASCRTAV
jgi:hypothetical protein